MFINAHLPPKANGKPRTNKDYFLQGWNAALEGYLLNDSPYYATSTADSQWRKGHKSAEVAS